MLGDLPSALGGALIQIPLHLKAASNEVQLNEIDCPQPLRNRPDTAVRLGVTNDIAQIGVGQFDNLASIDPTPASGPVQRVNAVGIAQIVTTQQIGPIALRSEGGGSRSCPGYANDLCFNGPFPPQPGAGPASDRANGEVAASLASGLDAISRALNQPGTLQVLDSCLPLRCDVTSTALGPVVANVTSLLNPVLANVLGPTLVQPLLSLLEVSINATDASVLAVYVDQPELFSATPRPPTESGTAALGSARP